MVTGADVRWRGPLREAISCSNGASFHRTADRDSFLPERFLRRGRLPKSISFEFGRPAQRPFQVVAKSIKQVDIAFWASLVLRSACEFAREWNMTFFKSLPDSPSSDCPQPLDVALDGDWHDPASGVAHARRSHAPSRQFVSCDSSGPADRAPPPALFLSETVQDLNIGARFLDRLSATETAELRKHGRRMTVPQGTAVFTQGDRHEGIFIIDGGQVRVYYTAPSGREITLAYWTPGHFIGGPEITGGGAHMWSGVAVNDCEITLLSGATLQRLLTRIPNFALALIDGLVAKGKCYSSMAQMLGTRSVIERLAQYLLNLSELYGEPDGTAVVIARRVTHDQIAAMVGSTRQWVTMMLKRFQNQHIVSIDGSVIRIERIDLLEQILFKD
jgi:CRP/FNR family cyclic AMP-dependent transcriptional regulator